MTTFTLNLLPSILGIIVVLSGFFLAFKIRQKDPKYILNNFFAFSLSSFAFGIFFFTLNYTLPYFIIDPILLTDLIVINQKLFLLFIALALIAFYIGSFILYYGVNIIKYYKDYLGITFSYLIIIPIWIYGLFFTDSISPDYANINFKSGFLFIYIAIPLAMFIMIAVFIVFWKVYTSIDEEKNEKLKNFLIGWLILVISIVIATFSVIYQNSYLSVVSMLFLVIGMFFITRGFN